MLATVVPRYAAAVFWSRSGDLISGIYKSFGFNCNQRITLSVCVCIINSRFGRCYFFVHKKAPNFVKLGAIFGFVYGFASRLFYCK